MKDIDFDELDKAVGSVLGSEDHATSTAPAQSALNGSSASQTPATREPQVSTDASAQPAPTTPPVAPARRRGQFLDMVHPSADMRNRSSLPPSAPRKTLTPLNPSATPEANDEPKPATTETASVDTEPTVVPASDNPTVTPETPATDEPITVASDEPAPSSHGSWPDPIDFAQKATNVDDTGEEVESNAEPEEPTTEPTEPSAFNDTSQTPFVTDAKVDKRPLGAFAAPEAESGEVITPEAVATSDEGTAAPIEPLAPELNPEVNSVEAAGVEDHSEPAEVKEPAPEPTPAPVVPEKESAKPAEVSPAPTETNGVAASIPQQYKPAAAKKDDQEHPLFDSEEYHQPLLPAHTKKRHKAGLIIVLLIALLAIGGVLGYFAFTMGF